MIVNRREEEEAEDQCHRHRHRTEHKPSTASAVGRDKKNENKNPGSDETQRGPPPQLLLLCVFGGAPKAEETITPPRGLANPIKLYAIQTGRVDAGEHPREGVDLTRLESSKRPDLCGYPQAAPLEVRSPPSRH